MTDKPTTGDPTPLDAEYAAARPVPAGPGEATCERCGGPNVWSWHAPSPLWNRVMRDPETGADRWGIVCPSCFAALAEDAGLGGPPLDGKPRWTWHFGPHEDVSELWIDRDGRQWNAASCLWEARPVPAGPESIDEGRWRRDGWHDAPCWRAWVANPDGGCTCGR